MWSGGISNRVSTTQGSPLHKTSAEALARSLRNMQIVAHPPNPNGLSWFEMKRPPTQAASPLRGVSSEVLPSARQLSTIHAQPMPPFIIPCSRGVGGPGLVTTSSLLTGTSHTARKPCLPTHGHQPVPKTPQASLTPSTKHIHNVTPSPREHGILEGDNGRCEPEAVRTRGRTMGPTLLSALALCRRALHFQALKTGVGRATQ